GRVAEDGALLGMEDGESRRLVRRDVQPSRSSHVDEVRPADLAQVDEPRGFVADEVHDAERRSAGAGVGEAVDSVVADPGRPAVARYGKLVGLRADLPAPERAARPGGASGPATRR